MDYLQSFLRANPKEQWDNSGLGYFFYFHYYAIQAHYQFGGKHWNDWHPRVRELLLDKQNADGSWDVPGGTAENAGVVVISTAGNWGTNKLVDFPGKSTHTMCIATTDAAGNLGAGTTTHTHTVDVTAPVPTITVNAITADNILNAAEAGANVTVTGTVTNTGNITLTNVVVTNTIGALQNLSRRVLGPITLAPGAGASFSDSYTVPLDSCGPYTDTLTARGNDKCFGVLASSTDTKNCPGTNTPMSASMLNTMKAEANSSPQACTTGTSCLETASTISCPSPG